MLVFGVTCVVLDATAYSLHAWLGSKTQRFTANEKFVRASNRTAGGMLLAAGATMATVKRAIRHSGRLRVQGGRLIE